MYILVDLEVMGWLIWLVLRTVLETQEHPLWQHCERGPSCGQEVGFADPEVISSDLCFLIDSISKPSASH